MAVRALNEEAPLPGRADILVVGGYGVVGRRIAAHLAPRFPGRVVIAGRDEQRALVLCGDLGHGVLSLGDEYGPDSLQHVLEAVTQPFSVHEDGRPREALPFNEGVRVRFPAPEGSRTAYLFPWSDVVCYPRTLGARTAIGRFALEPAWTR